MELIENYFPELTDKQKDQFRKLGPLYSEWNAKINVISRKDIDQLYLHHVLHSLAIAKHNSFHPGTHILDIGTGGGFPGIPLAILFPDVKFTLLDATAKKIRVVNEVSRAIDLNNVTGVHARAEDYNGEFDVVVSRAVSTLAQIVAWTKHLVPSGHWIALKGGDQKEIRKELPPLFKMTFVPINAYFQEEFFIDKYVIDVRSVRA